MPTITQNPARCNSLDHSLDHSDRDEVRIRATEDFLNLYLEHGGTQRWKSLKCLFHEDKNPSARIWKGRFYCFTCELSLDPFEFIQRVPGLDFKGALAFPAARYGIPLRRSTKAEMQDYARRYAAADREGQDLVEWKRENLTVLRAHRDVYLAAFHRCKRYIIQHGADAPFGELAMDAAETYEKRFQEFDAHLARVEGATWVELLSIFRGRRDARH